MPTVLDVGSEVDRREVRSSVALCLSGGGYRGMLFSLGALWRLNELGCLPRVAIISSVSGASIAAGALAAAWDTLPFDGAGVSVSFVERVVEPARRLARESVDSWALNGSVLFSTPAGDIVSDAYDGFLFSGMTLQDLPNDEDGRAPAFVFTALNLQSGERVELSRRCIVDSRTGRIDRPTVRLALTISGCSAFAPLMPPVTVPVEPGSLESNPHPPALALTDASVCDSLALTAVWRSHSTLLVSDGGGNVAPDDGAYSDWFPAARRLVDVVTARSYDLFRQQLNGVLRRPRIAGADERNGAYWSLRGDSCRIADGLSTPEQAELATGPVRLDAMPDALQERLINAGYLACDAAIPDGLFNDAARRVARPPYQPAPVGGVTV